MSLNNKTIDGLYQQKKTQILCNDADAHKEKWESLSPEYKDLFVKNNVAAQRKHRKSLSLDDKVQILTNDAAAHKKKQESLFPEQKSSN